MLPPVKVRASALGLFPEQATPRLYDQVIDVLRLHHYSLRTEEAYVGWIRRFLTFHPGRHPRNMGCVEVTAFLSHLASHGHVAASTQNQALSALLFLYQKVLQVNLPWLDDVVRAKRPKRLPAVLTRNEVQRVLAELDGVYRLVGLLLYGSGLRLLECLRLRVKDVDFDARQIIVREGKGDKDRYALFPDLVATDLQQHLTRVASVRPDSRSGPSAAPVCLAAKAADSVNRLGVAVRVPFNHDFTRSAFRTVRPAPPARVRRIS